MVELDDSFDRLRLRVGIEAPIEAPTIREIASQMDGIIGSSRGLVLERAESSDRSSLYCVHTTFGWYLTRRGTEPEEVAQGNFKSNSSALEAICDWAARIDRSPSTTEFQPIPVTPIPPIDAEGCRWVRSEWDEEDLVFYYEINAVGIVIRAVELGLTDGVPQAAARLVEWAACQHGLRQPQTAETERYQLRFGSVPEGNEGDWGEYRHDVLTGEEFEEVWRRARDHLSRQAPT